MFNVLKAFFEISKANNDLFNIKYFPEYKTMLAPSKSLRPSSRIEYDKVISALEKDQPLKNSLDIYEKIIIQNAIRRHKRISEVAEVLGIHRSNLDVKRKKFSLVSIASSLN